MAGLSRAICIPRHHGASGATTPPRELMAEWLAARHFEPCESVPQWPCDDELERGLFLFTNERWTILLYSGIDGMLQEDNRLLLHLGRLRVPVLYVWSAMGAWGYRIHEGREVLDAYHSGTDFSPEWMKDYAGHGDLQFLCETFGLAARPEKLKQICHSRVIAREDVVARFCEELGVSPAGVAYDDVEWRFLTREAGGTFDGFTVWRGYFVKRGFRPVAASLKLHEIPARAQAARDAWWPAVELNQEYLLGLVRLMLLIRAVLLPLTWLFFAMFKTAMWTDRFYRFMGWDQRSTHKGTFAEALFADGQREPFVVEGRRLVNTLRGCEVTIPQRAKPAPQQCVGVFAFKVGKAFVQCDAVRPDAEGYVRRMFFYPPGFEIVADEMFTVGPHPARHVGWKMDEGKRSFFAHHWIVQTKRAYFEFSCRSNSAAEAEKMLPLVRGVVESFRLTQPLSADTSAAVAAAPTA
jgi:hypothetical protein